MKSVRIILGVLLTLAFLLPAAVAEEAYTQDDYRQFAINAVEQIDASQRFCDNVVLQNEISVCERDVGAPIIVVAYTVEDIAGNTTDEIDIFLGDIYIDSILGMATALSYYQEADFSDSAPTAMGDYMVYVLAYNTLMAAAENGECAVVFASDIAEEAGIAVAEGSIE